MRRYFSSGILSLCLLAAGLAGAASYPYSSGGRWELLGRQEVDFRRDQDRIDVGRGEGRFKQLQIRVKDAPIEISKMVVTFNNNQRFSPTVRHRFAEGSGTRIFDLPGERRTIKQIDFNYRSMSRREGTGTVEVYGR